MPGAPSDPFGLRAWHCLDYRMVGGDRSAMTKDELAAQYVRARTNLIAARKGFDDAELKKVTCDSARARTDSVLNDMFKRKDSHIPSVPDGLSEKDFARATLALAEATAKARAADVAMTEAHDALNGCLAEVDRLMEAMVETFPKVA